MKRTTVCSNHFLNLPADLWEKILCDHGPLEYMSSFICDVDIRFIAAVRIQRRVRHMLNAIRVQWKAGTKVKYTTANTTNNWRVGTLIRVSSNHDDFWILRANTADHIYFLPMEGLRLRNCA